MERMSAIVTIMFAALGDRSPDAIGSLGLLILSISTSVIWFTPVMYRFISNDGIIANNAEMAVAVVNASL